jgi:hypothetical protein
LQHLTYGWHVPYQATRQAQQPRSAKETQVSRGPHGPFGGGPKRLIFLSCPTASVDFEISVRREPYEICVAAQELGGDLHSSVRSTDRRCSCPTHPNQFPWAEPAELKTSTPITYGGMPSVVATEASNLQPTYRSLSKVNQRLVLHQSLQGVWETSCRTRRGPFLAVFGSRVDNNHNISVVRPAACDAMGSAKRTRPNILKAVEFAIMICPAMMKSFFERRDEVQIFHLSPCQKWVRFQLATQPF